MAITAPPAITALPPPPDPNDRASFNTRAYPWAVAQQTLATEVGAAASNVFSNATEAATLASTASSQVALASAAANYKGLWSSLSGALTMPATVSHNGNYWALNADLANVAASTPGVSGNWQPLNVGAGGSLTSSAAVDVTLTSASQRVQAVTMTAADKSVVLPVATTLSAGAELFVIRNAGDYAFCVRDSAGTLLFKLTPGQTAALHLVDAATEAGKWAVTGDEIADTIFQATALNVTASESTLMTIVPLSSTQCLAVWANAWSAIGVCVLMVSGTTLSVGSVLTTAVSVYSTLKFKMVALSATQGLLVYGAVTTGYLCALTLNVSGMTVTVGAALQFSTVLANFSDLVRLSETQAVVTYNGTSNYGEARTLNVSGTTVTAGTALVVWANATATSAAAKLTATTLVAGYSVSGSATFLYVLSVSGTTLSTVGSYTPVAGCAVSVGSEVSATQVLFFGYDSTSSAYPPIYWLLDTSGGVILMKDSVTLTGGELNNPNQSITKLSESRFLTTRTPRGGDGAKRIGTCHTVRVADSRVMPSPRSEPIKGLATGGYGFATACALSANKVVAIYQESNGYAQARVIEVAEL